MPDSSFSFTAEVRPVCELGLSAARSAEPDTWEDVSCYVHEVELFRGRERFNDRFEAATASISFDNRSGWGDLVGAPLVVAAQKLRPGRQMRVGVVGPWGTRWLFRGWIDRCEPKYDPVLHDIVVADCIDALGEAGSTIAPLGPVVGANETVDARLHRVLDSVGWFGTKRIIGASATTVISTQLGQRAIDMLSQAADSAGGVVHGDLAGNVVFKDLNWELFDPDDPPDGGIGNVDPGTPGIPGGPGYIDPDPGYVYNPDPPPITGAFTVKVCADGTEGTLVQQGDQFHIYAQDGRLLFSSSGHTWDLGDFDGGCVAVSFDPTDPDPTPVRWDEDPEDPGVYQIADPPAEYVPCGPPEVELLGWSQSGIAQGQQAGYTIGPVDCEPGDILILISMGIGASEEDTWNLYPWPPYGYIRGGPFGAGVADDNTYGQHATNNADNACLQMVVIETGRDDGGTFTLEVNWGNNAGGTTGPQNYSKAHAAVLYRARKIAAGFVEGWAHHFRTFNYYVANAWSWGDGNGPQTFDLGDFYGYNPPILGPEDVVILASLAEQSTPPYGATYGGGGTWTTPPSASDITRQVSWATGLRTDELGARVDITDVNLGDDNRASAWGSIAVQAYCPDLFKVILTDEARNAPAAGTISSIATHSVVKPGEFMVLMVGLTADHDVVDAVTVTCDDYTIDFIKVHAQHYTAPSRGQGVIFTGYAPSDLPLGEQLDINVTWPGHVVEGAGAVTFEVDVVDQDAPTGAVGSGVLGDNTNGSVNGAVSCTLSAAPAATSATIAFLYISKDGSSNGGIHSGGDEWIEEVEIMLTTTRCMYQAQTRMPDQTESSDPVVGWNDAQTGTALTRSGVMLAIEVVPAEGFRMVADSGQSLVIGGELDAFNGPITSASAVTGLDPNIGDLLWSLDPLEVILP